LALSVDKDPKEKIKPVDDPPGQLKKTPEAPTVLLFVTGILGLGLLWRYKSLRSPRWGTAS